MPISIRNTSLGSIAAQVITVISDSVSSKNKKLTLSALFLREAG